jgi:uncharacterized membrane protein YkoI
MHLKPHLLALLTALAVLSAGTAAAEGSHEGESDHDQDRAFEALQRGEVLPLDKVLAGLGQRHPGELIGVELERREGRWIYEVRLIDGSGRLIDLDIDARTGKVIRPEGE